MVRIDGSLGIFFANPGITVLRDDMMGKLPSVGTTLELGTTKGVRERIHAMEP